MEREKSTRFCNWPADLAGQDNFISIYYYIYKEFSYSDPLFLNHNDLIFFTRLGVPHYTYRQFEDGSTRNMKMVISQRGWGATLLSQICNHNIAVYRQCPNPFSNNKLWERTYIELEIKRKLWAILDKLIKSSI